MRRAAARVRGRLECERGEPTCTSGGRVGRWRQRPSAGKQLRQAPRPGNREKFLHVVGIHGYPVVARRAVDRTRRTGSRVANPYDHPWAFTYFTTPGDRKWLTGQGRAGVGRG